MRTPRVLTWHVHGTYLHYLSHAPLEIYVPVKSGRPSGYVGLPSGGHPWRPNLHEVPADEVPGLAFDCVLFQTRRNFEVDQLELLTDQQRGLPKVYLEHDPPQEHPTNTRHPVDDPNALLVHVTHFNALMWDSGRTPTRVIEHGVEDPVDAHYSGEIERGLVVVNHLARRGRRLGADVFEMARQAVPLDLVGMASDELGGLGEVPHDRLAAFAARYRFFFNPIRYTSLGLAVCEAMMLGMPVVGLATTELAAIIRNGESGYVDTEPRRLIDAMSGMLASPSEAKRLGEGARALARERFNIERFARDWRAAIDSVVGQLYDSAPVGRPVPALAEAS